MAKISFETKYNVEKTLRKDLITDYRLLEKDNVKLIKERNKLSNLIIKLYGQINKRKHGKGSIRKGN